MEEATKSVMRRWHVLFRLFDGGGPINNQTEGAEQGMIVYAKDEAGARQELMNEMMKQRLYLSHIVSVRAA